MRADVPAPAAGGSAIHFPVARPRRRLNFSARIRFALVRRLWPESVTLVEEALVARYERRERLIEKAVEVEASLRKSHEELCGPSDGALSLERIHSDILFIRVAQEMER